MFDYQWQRCDEDGNNCNDISGATNFFYVLTMADAGSTIRLVVTATNADGSVSASSDPSGIVVIPPPTNYSIPVVGGMAGAGHTLTTTMGDWSGTPSFNYQWRRCDTNGDNCVDINGATNNSYAVQNADIGNTIRSQVTATNSAGDTVANSNETSIVVANGATLWLQPPATLSNTHRVSYVQQNGLVENNNGKAAVLMKASSSFYYPDDELQVRMFDGISWGPIQTIATDATTGSDASIAINDNGDVIVGWLSCSCGGFNAIKTRIYSGGSWSATMTIDDGSGDQSPSDGPVVGIDSNGKAIIAYHVDDSLDSYQRWLASEYDGNDWSSSPHDISGPIESGDYDFAMSSNGTAMFVFDGNDLGIGNYSQHAIYFNGTSWSPSTVIDSSEVFRNRVVADGSGNFIVAYRDTDSGFLTTRYFNGSSWGTPQEVNQQTNFSIAMNEAGNAVMSWNYGGSLSVAKTSDGTWTTTVADNASPQEFAVGIGPTGTVTLLYSDNTTGAGVLYVVRSNDDDYITNRIYLTDTNIETPLNEGHVTSDVVTWHSFDYDPDTDTYFEVVRYSDFAAQPSSPTEAIPADVTGTTIVGGELIAGTGDWDGTTPIDFDYQWQQCDVDGNNCSDIPGATNPTYTPTSGDVGHRIKVAVTANNSQGSSASTSDPSGIISGDSAPTLELTPTAHDYGSRDFNSGPTSSQDFVLSNTGIVDANISFAAIGGTDSNQFIITDSDCAGVITPTNSCTVKIVFDPDSVGLKNATLQLVDDAADSPQSSTLSGTGTDSPPPPAPAVSITPTTKNFGSMLVDSGPTSAQDFNVTNTGDAILNITGAAIVGADAGEFQVTTNICGATLAPTNSCIVSAVFDPTSTGSKNATLQLTDDAADSPQSLALSGNGTNTTDSAPVVVNKPVITGETYKNSSLHGDEGTWTGTVPITYNYQWQRCDNVGNNCVEIINATTADYVLNKDDLDSRLRLKVSAHNSIGDTDSISDASSVVKAKEIQITNTKVIGPRRNVVQVGLNTQENGTGTVVATTSLNGKTIVVAYGTFGVSEAQHIVLHMPVKSKVKEIIQKQGFVNVKIVVTFKPNDGASAQTTQSFIQIKPLSIVSLAVKANKIQVIMRVPQSGRLRFVSAINGPGPHKVIIGRRNLGRTKASNDNGRVYTISLNKAGKKALRREKKVQVTAFFSNGRKKLLAVRSKTLQIPNIL